MRYKIKIELEINFSEKASRSLNVLSELMESGKIEKPGKFLYILEQTTEAFNEMGYPERAILAVPKFETTIEKIEEEPLGTNLWDSIEKIRKEKD